GYGIWEMGYGIWDMGDGRWEMGYWIWDIGYWVWDVSGVGWVVKGGGVRFPSLLHRALNSPAANSGGCAVAQLVVLKHGLSFVLSRRSPTGRSRKLEERPVRRPVRRSSTSEGGSLGEEGRRKTPGAKR
ncbi:MAG: hypothetical protein RI897_3836, partial [Verrucomicrobiota bacterium]